MVDSGGKHPELNLLMYLGEHERRDDVDVEDVVHHARPDGRQPRQVRRAGVVDQAAQAERGGQGLRAERG